MCLCVCVCVCVCVWGGGGGCSCGCRFVAVSLIHLLPFQMSARTTPFVRIVDKQVLKTFSKHVEGCRDGSAKNHMN